MHSPKQKRRRKQIKKPRTLRKNKQAQQIFYGTRKLCTSCGKSYLDKPREDRRHNRECLRFYGKVENGQSWGHIIRVQYPWPIATSIFNV